MKPWTLNATGNLITHYVYIPGIAHNRAVSSLSTYHPVITMDSPALPMQRSEYTLYRAQTPIRH